MKHKVIFISLLAIGILFAVQIQVALGDVTASEDFKSYPAWSTLSAANWTYTNASRFYTDGIHQIYPGGLMTMWWNANSFNGNHYSQVVLKDLSVWGGGPAVRIQSGADSYYWFANDSNNGLKIGKVISGVSSVLTSTTPKATTNDVLRLEVSGSKLTGKKNGMVVLTATDSTLSGGAPGIYGSNNDAGQRLDDWEGGNLVATPDTAPPTTPQNVSGTPTSQNSVTISWSASLDNVEVSGYQIHRGNSPSSLIQVATTASLSYTDSGLSPLTTYYYSVSAHDTSNNVSIPSTPISVTTKAPDTTAPTVPRNLTGLAIGSKVNLSWSNSTDPDNTAVSYKIFRDGSQIATTAATNYSDTGLSPNTTYYYSVSAHDPAGNDSGQSTPVAITTTNTDQYGGMLNITGTVTGSFHTEKIGNRWWIVTPEGHGIFIRAVSGVNDIGSDTPLSYGAVYVEAGGSISANLKEKALSTIVRDVIHPQSGVTIKNTGDAIYIGDNTKLNNTYFWLDQMGSGGKINWYYSTSGGWKLINGTGNPYASSHNDWSSPSHLNPDGSYNFDLGYMMAPTANGFGDWNNPKANLIIWWNMAGSGFPADFAPVTLPGDSIPNYYIKGVVTQDFTVAPVLNQTYELGGAIYKKYGGTNTPSDYTEIYKRWAENSSQRLKSWGFNAAGMYSNRYLGTAPYIADRLPTEPTWQLSDHTIRTDYPYHIKSLYAHVTWSCPNGNSASPWNGGQVDVFEPTYATAMRTEVMKSINDINAPWNFILIPEEADNLYGLNSNEHAAFISLVQNPYNNVTTGNSDTKLYAKYAVRDFLRYRYKDPSDTISAFTVDSISPAYTYNQTPSSNELKALQNLNTAWNTNYTTWGTSSGSLDNGTNAYGTGTGFMDENGKNVLASTACGDVSFKDSFTKNATIRQDFDDFLALFAAKYGKVLSQAFSGTTHPAIFVPIYGGPAIVYREIAPYVDGFWINPGVGGSSNVVSQANTTDVYNASHKPIYVADYLESTPDSPSYFQGTISAISYNTATNRTRIVTPDLKYNHRVGWAIRFKELADTEYQGGKCGWGLWTTPGIVWVNWNTFEIGRDYTVCVTPGMHFELVVGDPRYTIRTQEERAQKMTERYNSLINLKGDDNFYFVVGLEHWNFYDNGINSWAEIYDFGLVTTHDNAYDGVEAKMAVSTNSYGYQVGGEDNNYGNLLGSLGDYLRSMENRLQYSGAPPSDTTSPSTLAGLTATVISSSQINLSWSASTDNVGVTGYKVYRNGSQITTTVNTAYSDTGLSPSTSYSYTVSAYDAAGNGSNATSPVSATTSAVSPPSTSTLAVSLSASPVSGQSPLTVTLTANVSGTAVGNVNYTFYCNRSDSDTNITTPYDAKYDNNPAAAKTTTCTYNSAGTYTSKVIVERGAASPAEARITIIVSAPSAPSPAPPPSGGGGGGGYSPPAGTLSVSLTASPSFGPTPLFSAITAAVSGAPGPVNFTFYCDREDAGTNIDNYYSAKYSTSFYSFRYAAATTTSKTVSCSYYSPGTFIPKVIVESGTFAPAEARVAVTVSAPGTIASPPIPLVPGQPPAQPPSVSQTEPFQSTLSIGMSSPEIFVLQQFLNVSRTGYFGPITQKAVQSFQTQYNLSQTAIVDSQTRAKLNALYKQKTTVSKTAVNQCFNLNLSLGQTNTQISLLQQYLSRDSSVYPEGLVTGYFGNLTKQAIIRFQAKYSLNQTGTIDEPTRAKLNEIYCAQPPSTATGAITVTLSYGIQNEQVRVLQTILSKDSEVYPEALITGYFGQLTRKAVQRFQCKYNIVCSGNEYTTGYGMVGPKTRAKLDELR